MSLITRCPRCGTQFKVVPDQLKISQGWVRCGHCAEVFDAPQHMLARHESTVILANRAAPSVPEATPPAPLSAPVHTPLAAPTALPPAPAAASPAFASQPTMPIPLAPMPAPPVPGRPDDAPNSEADWMHDWEEVTDDARNDATKSVATPAYSTPASGPFDTQKPIPPTPVFAPPPMPRAAPPDDALAQEVAQFASKTAIARGVAGVTTAPTPITAVSAPITAPVTAATTTAPAVLAPPRKALPQPKPSLMRAPRDDDDDQDSQPDFQDSILHGLQRKEDFSNMTFVRRAQKRATWQRPLVRTFMALLAFGLLVLLAAQVAHQQRDHIAAMQPQLKPYLQQFCDLAQCDIKDLQQIESIVIDSSSFNKSRTDTYTLSFVIKNTAALPVALPSLELTLNDSTDKPVARRVLGPKEFGARNALLNAGGEFTGSLAISVAELGRVGAGAANAGAPPNALRIAGYRLLAFYP
jgi:predicted Zn finger-like uncharacterized protein